MSEKSNTLKRIEHEIDQLVSIMKLANKDKLDVVRNELKSDKEKSKILEICQQPTSFSGILDQVKQATGASEATVKRRLAELRELGTLITSRQRREVFYVDSGLLD